MRRGRRSEEPQALGQVLESVLSGRPWGAGLALGQLGRRWSSVVGERLAQECHPARLDGGVLFVRASSAAWAAQLTFLAAQVRDRGNAILENAPIREVRVLVGDRPRGGRGAGPGAGT